MFTIKNTAPKNHKNSYVFKSLYEIETPKKSVDNLKLFILFLIKKGQK